MSPYVVLLALCNVVTCLHTRLYLSFVRTQIMAYMNMCIFFPYTNNGLYEYVYTVNFLRVPANNLFVQVPP